MDRTPEEEAVQAVSPETTSEAESKEPVPADAAAAEEAPAPAPEAEGGGGPAVASAVSRAAARRSANTRQVASKWIKNSVLRLDPRIACHLPETRCFSAGQLLAMLNRYRQVVLKPVIGTGGRGVILVSKHSRGYTVRHRRAVIRCSGFHAMLKCVNRLRRRRSYLVQRGIRLAMIQGRPIDYRVKVVRQESRWVTRAIVGRLANPGMFVTNLCRGGTLLTSAEGIRRSFSPAAVRRKKNEMRRLTRLGTELLERRFPGIGELGFDYGFDRAGRLWIFEVNTRPH